MLARPASDCKGETMRYAYSTITDLARDMADRLGLEVDAVTASLGEHRELWSLGGMPMSDLIAAEHAVWGDWGGGAVVGRGRGAGGGGGRGGRGGRATGGGPPGLDAATGRGLGGRGDADPGHRPGLQRAGGGGVGGHQDRGRLGRRRARLARRRESGRAARAALRY